MGYTPDPIDKTGLILDVIARRQQAVGANLANVHTPGYKRQDVSFERMLGAIGSPIETRLSEKLGPSPFLNEEGGEVSAPAELILMQKNMLFYTIATRRITSLIQELKTVTQVGR